MQPTTLTFSQQMCAFMITNQDKDENSKTIWNIFESEIKSENRMGAQQDYFILWEPHDMKYIGRM